MFVVVEGPDGSGKTTLVRAARNTSSNTISISRNPMYGNPETRLKAMFEFMYWASVYPPDHHLIVDRYPAISERVYGPILRNENLLDKHPLDFGMGKVDAIIYCRPRMGRIIANLPENEQLSGVNEKIHLIVEAYDAVINQFSEITQVFVYDYEAIKPNQVWSRVFNTLARNYSVD